MRGTPIGCASKHAYGARCAAAHGGVCSHPCTGSVHWPRRLRTLPTTMGARGRVCNGPACTLHERPFRRRARPRMRNAERPEHCVRLSPRTKQAWGCSPVQRGVPPGVDRAARRALPAPRSCHRRSLGQRQRTSPGVLSDGIGCRTRPAAPQAVRRGATVRGTDAVRTAANDGAVSGTLLPPHPPLRRHPELAEAQPRHGPIPSELRRGLPP